MSRRGARVPFPCPVELGRVGPRGEEEARALHDAVGGARLANLRKLLKTGLNPDLPNDDGQTPLFMAAITGQSQAVEQLLHCGADPNRRSEDGATPMHAAAFSGCVPLLLAMLGAGGDLRLHDRGGRSPADWAAEAGPRNQSVLELLGHCWSEMLRLGSHATGRTCQSGAPQSPRHAALAVPHSSLRRLLRFKGQEEEQQLGALDARSRSCLRLENLGYGMVCTGPRGSLGYAAFLPIIPQNELYHDENDRHVSYANGPHTLMTSLVWSGTKVTVRDVRPEGEKGRARRLADLLVAEQEAYRGLRCPELLLLMGVSLVDGLRSPRLVFERVRLGSLYSVLHERKLDFPVLCHETILRLLLQVCTALRFLHNRGVLHAGLSSHAVHLVSPDTAKLSGLEYAMPSGPGDRARPGRLLPPALHRWLPLEVLEGRNISAKSDVYSYCTIVYEIFSDSLPWAEIDDPFVKKLLVSGQQMPVERSLPEPWLDVVRAGTVVAARERSLTLSDVHFTLRQDLAEWHRTRPPPASRRSPLSLRPLVDAPPAAVSPSEGGSPTLTRPLATAYRSDTDVGIAARDVTDAPDPTKQARHAALRSASAGQAAELGSASKPGRRGARDVRVEPGSQKGRPAPKRSDGTREKPGRDPEGTRVGREAGEGRRNYHAYNVPRGVAFEVSFESSSSQVEDSPKEEASLRQTWSHADARGGHVEIRSVRRNTVSRPEVSSEAEDGFQWTAAQRGCPYDDEEDDDAGEIRERPFGGRRSDVRDTTRLVPHALGTTTTMLERRFEAGIGTLRGLVTHDGRHDTHAAEQRHDTEPECEGKADEGNRQRAAGMKPRQRQFGDTSGRKSFSAAEIHASGPRSSAEPSHQATGNAPADFDEVDRAVIGHNETSWRAGAQVAGKVERKGDRGKMAVAVDVASLMAVAPPRHYRPPQAVLVKQPRLNQCPRAATTTTTSATATKPLDSPAAEPGARGEVRGPTNFSEWEPSSVVDEVYVTTQRGESVESDTVSEEGMAWPRGDEGSEEDNDELALTEEEPRDDSPVEQHFRNLGDGHQHATPTRSCRFILPCDAVEQPERGTQGPSACHGSGAPPKPPRAQGARCTGRAETDAGWEAGTVFPRAPKSGKEEKPGGSATASVNTRGGGGTTSSEQGRANSAPWASGTGEKGSGPPAGSVGKSSARRREVGEEEPEVRQEASPELDDSFVTKRRGRNTPGVVAQAGVSRVAVHERKGTMIDESEYFTPELNARSRHAQFLHRLQIPVASVEDLASPQLRRQGLVRPIAKGAQRRDLQQEHANGAAALHRAEEEDEESEGSSSDEAGTPRPPLSPTSRSLSDTGELSCIVHDASKSQAHSLCLSSGVPSPSCRATESTPKQPASSKAAASDREALEDTSVWRSFGDERPDSFTAPASGFTASTCQAPPTMPVACSSYSSGGGEDWDTPRSTARLGKSRMAPAESDKMDAGATLLPPSEPRAARGAAGRLRRDRPGGSPSHAAPAADGLPRGGPRALPGSARPAAAHGGGREAEGEAEMEQQAEGGYETAHWAEGSPDRAPAPSFMYDTCKETPGSFGRTCEWGSTDDADNESNMKTETASSAPGERAEGTTRVPASDTDGAAGGGGGGSGEGGEDGKDGDGGEETAGEMVTATALDEHDVQGGASGSRPSDSGSSVDEMNSAFLSLDTTAALARESTWKEEVEWEEGAAGQGAEEVSSHWPAGDAEEASSRGKQPRTVSPSHTAAAPAAPAAAAAACGGGERGHDGDDHRPERTWSVVVTEEGIRAGGATPSPALTRAPHEAQQDRDSLEEDSDSGGEEEEEGEAAKRSKKGARPSSGDPPATKSADASLLPHFTVAGTSCVQSRVWEPSTQSTFPPTTAHTHPAHRLRSPK
ncbi:inactive serine/threonine-protein kinase TEX14 isoform X2 [Petromyzon marinus]|uniref:inactive serine/threonine-protein kinase TEX14 isoform X2 n=1 Tax=Petromyzon marinus TaxID=7757 RepID=UPI003F727E70